MKIPSPYNTHNTKQPILSIHLQVPNAIKPLHLGAHLAFIFELFSFFYTGCYMALGPTPANTYVPIDQLIYHSHVYKHCVCTTNHTTRLALFVT